MNKAAWFLFSLFPRKLVNERAYTIGERSYSERSECVVWLGRIYKRNDKE